MIWNPWINFYSEDLLIQFFWLFSLGMFIRSINNHFSLLILCILLFLWGLFLCFYNLEVLSGFFFITELTAIFIILLFLLCLNFEGLKNITNNNIINGWYIYIFFFFFLFLL